MNVRTSETNEPESKFYGILELMSKYKSFQSSVDCMIVGVTAKKSPIISLTRRKDTKAHPKPYSIDVPTGITFKQNFFCKQESSA